MLGIIYTLLYYLIRIFDLILLVYCVFSWFVRDPYNKVYRFLCSICDPVLNPIRELLNKVSFFQGSPIDFSPVVVMLILSFLLRLL